MQTTFLLSWITSVLSIAAQNTNLPRVGINKPGIGDTPEALRISEAAGRNPNATTAVAFSRTFNNTPETWGWRVNISEVVVPNRILDLGSPTANFSESLRIANTQWQLDWPDGNDSFQSYLEVRNLSISFTTLVSNKPSNITGRYNSADNGNCTAILGEQCAQSLLRSASRDNPSFFNLQGCENTLSVTHGSQDGGTGSVIDASNAATLQRGSTFFFRASETYATGNLTLLHESESALQLLVMNFKSAADTRGSISGPTVLCTVVDKAAATSAAASWHKPSTISWVGGIVCLMATNVIWW